VTVVVVLVGVEVHEEGGGRSTKIGEELAAILTRGETRSPAGRGDFASFGGGVMKGETSS
jgi:hypothetical protein